MAFKRPLPILSLPSKINNKNISTKSNCCLVCDDKARINYYGARACQSCKTFFRRHGFRPELVCPCRYNGECEVNILTRHMCTACRLNKCFSVGMSSHLIRKEVSHVKTKSKSMKSSKCKIIMPVLQLPTLDLLHNDRSSLTASEWTLFRNVIHAYDTFSIVPKLQHLLNNLSSSPSKVCFDTADVLEIVGSVCTSMQSFISSTPDFQVLSVKEQQPLLERNLHGISCFSANVFYRDTNFFDNFKCYNSFITVYGEEIIKQTKHLINQIDLNSTLIKFMLLVITFSSNCFIVDVHDNISNDSFMHGTFRLFGSQNIYVELLWKYMVYRYGYDQTAIRFAGLIKYVLDSIRHAADIYMSNDVHHDFVDEVTKKTEEVLVINQNQTIPLWGKQ